MVQKRSFIFSLLMICCSVHSYALNAPSTLSTTQIASSPALSEISANGYVTIGYRESSIPFSYLDMHQQPIGYSIDLCRIIVDHLKVLLHNTELGIRYVPITSQNRLLLLKNGTIQMDCGSTSHLLSREKQADFSLTTYVSDVKIMVKKDSGIHTIADLDHKTVVTTSGTSSDILIRKAEKKAHIHLNIVYGRDHTNSFLMLKSGRAVAFVMDGVLLQGFLKNSSDNERQFTILPIILRSEPYAITLPKEDPVFKTIVNDSLRRVLTSQTIHQLYTKWFESPIPPYHINLSLPPSQGFEHVIQHPNDKGIADF